MNESKTGLFRSFWYSITSFSKYRLFLRQSTGRAVVYLLLLSVLSTVGIYTYIYSMVNEVADILTTEVAEEMPDFRLENGQLEVYAEMPIFIDSDPPIVIDTRPDIDVEDILYQYDNVMLITRDRYIVKSYLKRQEMSWSLIYGGKPVTRDNFADLVQFFKTMVMFVFALLAILAYIIVSASNFFSAFIVSGIGAIVNAAKGTGLSYRNIFKISIYSMTLPLTAGALLNILGISIPFRYVFFLAGCSVYIVGAINMIKAGFDSLYGNPGGFGGFRDPGDHTGQDDPSEPDK